MHADDIALATRIEKQVAYLTANPSIAIAGTWIESFLDPPISQFPIPNSQFPAPPPRHYPSDPRFTAPSLLFWCCFAHPTMMFRRHVLEGTASTPPLRYDPAFPMPCEDSPVGPTRREECTEMGNVPEVLLRYRLHAGQASAGRRRPPLPSPAKSTAPLSNPWASPRPPLTWICTNAWPIPICWPRPDFVHATRSWLERLDAANEQAFVYNAHAFPDPRRPLGRHLHPSRHARSPERSDDLA